MRLEALDPEVHPEPAAVDGRRRARPRARRATRSKQRRRAARPRRPPAAGPTSRTGSSVELRERVAHGPTTAAPGRTRVERRLTSGPRSTSPPTTSPPGSRASNIVLLPRRSGPDELQRAPGSLLLTSRPLSSTRKNRRSPRSPPSPSSVSSTLRRRAFTGVGDPGDAGAHPANVSCAVARAPARDHGGTCARREPRASGSASPRVSAKQSAAQNESPAP